jgi:DDE family transposase
VWLALVMMAQDLMVWAQVLTFDGRLRLAEPATLRYMVLHAPARIVRSGRKLKLKIQHDWPWAAQLVAAFGRLDALPAPAT